MNIACIDIGSNSLHIIVYKLRKGDISVLARYDKTLRLGSNENQTQKKNGMYIKNSAVRKIVKMVKDFKIIADLFEAEIRAIATSAMREAVNGKDIVKMIGKETGITVDIISSEQEGHFAYIGAVYSLELARKDVTVIDIGGGSIQMARGVAGMLSVSTGFPLGVVRMSERFFADGYTEQKVSELKEYITELLTPFIEKYQGSMVVGVSGTFKNLARITNELPLKSAQNGLIISRKSLETLKNEFPAMVLENTLPRGLNPTRKDTIYAGIIIVDTLFELLHVKEMTVATFGVKAGAVIDFKNKKPFEKK